MIKVLPRRSPGREVTIDGYEVPRVEVGEDPGSGLWCLFLDGRFGTEPVTLEELHRWLPIIAHALAIGAGYSCHGENSVFRPNPFKRRVFDIAVAEREDDEGGQAVAA